ncbi:MAG: phosphomannomutase/phosphoglucomutase [Candidatus Eutrophobiaceae bacterium]
MPEQHTYAQSDADLLKKISLQLEQSFAEVRSLLEEISNNEQVRAALAAKDMPALKEASRLWLEDISSHAIDLHFAPAGENFHADFQDLFSFGSLTVLRQLTDGKMQRFGPRMHRPQSPNAYIFLAQNVLEDTGDGDALLGTIMLRLAPSILEESLAAASLPEGSYLALDQRIKRGGAIAISASGNAQLRDSQKPFATRSIDNDWVLNLWIEGRLPAELPGDESSFLQYWMLAGIAAACLLLLWGALRIRQSASAIMTTQKGLRFLLPTEPPQFQGAAYVILQIPDHWAHKALPEWFTPSGASREDVATNNAKLPGDASADSGSKPSTKEPAITKGMFRQYDIRGIVPDELNATSVARIGRAIGELAKQQGQQRIVTGYDGRISGPKLIETLIKSLLDSGMDVVDIGMVPSPVLYFATKELDIGNGVMLTGSHNGPEYNGLKIMLGGKTLHGEDIQDILRILESGQFTSSKAGKLEKTDIQETYIAHIKESFTAEPQSTSLHIVLDAGNGVAGPLAMRVLESFKHTVTPLFCEVDGSFPNHPADPSQPENLAALADAVKSSNADLGIALDGDGDRLGVVDTDGKMIMPDRLLMLFAQDALSRHCPDATVIYDVKCSRHLESFIRAAGGTPMMHKTGHSLIKETMREIQAPIAGEFSGHFFFADLWNGFDDALYASVRLLQILIRMGNENHSSATQIFADLPEGFSSPELRLPAPAETHEGLILSAKGKFSDFPFARLVEIDGLRVELPEAWGLLRGSNTSPNLILRFEGNSPEALEEIMGMFRKVLLEINQSFKLPF